MTPTRRDPGDGSRDLDKTDERDDRREDAAPRAPLANVPNLPRLTVDERERVHGLIDQYAIECEQKAELHSLRIERVARHLGQQLRHGAITLADAKRRLDCVAYELDPDSAVPVAIVPADVARQIARQAFRQGLVR